MIFTRKKLTCPPILYLNSTPINLVTSQKFLGLILDAPFLTWRKHINYIKAVCNKRIRILKSLNCSNWGCQRSLLKNLYFSFIRSKMLYGLEVYSSASKSLLQSLEIINNNAIRIITGLRKSTPIKSIYYESSIPSINIYINFILVKQLSRIYSLPSNHISYKLISSQNNFLNNISWTTNPHKAPFYIRAIRSCNLLGFHFNNLSPIEQFMCPPRLIPFL